MPAQFFTENLDILFMAYGLSFVVMGIAIFAHPHRKSMFKLSGIIWLLALFGLLHGLHEWLELFEIVAINGHKHNSAVLISIRQWFQIISYLFLFEFGRRLIVLRKGQFLPKWVTVAFFFLTVFLFYNANFNPSVWPRYLLALPGGILSALGFFWYYRDNKNILRLVKGGKYFFFASLSIGLYGILSGLVVPKADFFPAAVINNSSFQSIFKVPVQIYRALAAVVLSWSVWNILDIFNWEMRQRLLDNSTEIRLSKNYLDNIISSIADSLIIVDNERKIKTVNPEIIKLLGYTKEEITGMPLTVIFKEKELFCENLRFKELLAGAAIKNYETICRAKDGSLIPVIISASNVKDNKGGPEGVVIIIKDITERKKAEASLKEAYNQLTLSKYRLMQIEKMDTIGRLASGVAHEVKNPLAIILQGIEYLSLKIPEDNQDFQMVFSYITEAVVRVNKIVKELMNFVKVTELSIEPANINYVIEDALLLVRNFIEANRIEIIKSFEADMPLMNLDKNKIEQALINIMMNSVDAMPGGGQLNIKTYVQKPIKAVFVEIEDSGIGVPEDVLEDIFEPFFTTKRAKGGTGLGLAVVKNIVEMHQAEINLKNRTNSHGVKVTLKLKI